MNAICCLFIKCTYCQRVKYMGKISKVNVFSRIGCVPGRASQDAKQNIKISIMTMEIGLLLLLGVLGSSSYVQMPLVRTPAASEGGSDLAPVHCGNLTAKDEAEFKQICYEKDITYSIPFIYQQMHYSLAADFTTPLSWLKHKECKIEGTHKRCHRITETIVEQFREHTRKSRLHRREDNLKENGVIEGSSERIRGQVEKQQTITLTVKDSNRLNNLMELLLLGFFIYGEKDNLTLSHTNFVNAMYITPNLDQLSDGAISLRLDNTAENSFLNQIFRYVDVVEKSVTISLNEDADSISIGDLTVKNTDKGYSGLQWIDISEEQEFGRLPSITGIGIGDLSDDQEDDTKQQLQGIFTLSASYISFPQKIIDGAILKKIGKEASCKINSKGYLECASGSHKKMEKLLDKNFVISFEKVNMVIPMKKLVRNMEHGKKVVFNIKKSFNNFAVLGEPLFKEYFFAFDYLNNKVGFSGKRTGADQFIFEIVTLVRFLCFVMAFGCCFIICYQPCHKIFRRSGRARRDLRIQRRKERERKEQQEAASINSEGYNTLAQTARSSIFDDNIIHKEQFQN